MPWYCAPSLSARVCAVLWYCAPSLAARVCAVLWCCAKRSTADEGGDREACCGVCARVATTHGAAGSCRDICISVRVGYPHSSTKGPSCIFSPKRRLHRNKRTPRSPTTMTTPAVELDGAYQIMYTTSYRLAVLLLIAILLAKRFVCYMASCDRYYTCTSRAP